MPRAGRTSAIYGEARTTDGRGLPVTVDTNRGLIDKAGIDPRELDAAVDKFISMVDGGASLLLENAPMLEKLMRMLKKEIEKQLVKFEEIAEADANMPPGEVGKPGITIMVATLLELANRVSILLDRINKMVTEGTKAKDMIVRLRTFIATGDEKDNGLEGMSENQLRRIINATANGDMLPPEQRRE